MLLLPVPAADQVLAALYTNSEVLGSVLSLFAPEPIALALNRPLELASAPLRRLQILNFRVIDVQVLCLRLRLCLDNVPAPVSWPSLF